WPRQRRVAQLLITGLFLSVCTRRRRGVQVSRAVRLLRGRERLQQVLCVRFRRRPARELHGGTVLQRGAADLRLAQERPMRRCGVQEIDAVSEQREDIRRQPAPGHQRWQPARVVVGAPGERDHATTAALPTDDHADHHHDRQNHDHASADHDLPPLPDHLL
ncbi:unnamed protein product, partial [Ixodes persulcatus]